MARGWWGEEDGGKRQRRWLFHLQLLDFSAVSSSGISSLPIERFLFWGFPDSSVGKESACNAGDLGSIPGLGRSPGEGKDYPIPYSGLEKSMTCRVHGVAKSRTGLSNFHFT